MVALHHEPVAEAIIPFVVVLCIIIDVPHVNNLEKHYRHVYVEEVVNV